MDSSFDLLALLALAAFAAGFVDGIAGGADIDFEPARLGLQIQPASLG